MFSRACIIEVALNGMTSRDANPHVPRAPADITADARACVQAGATIVHNHTDDPLWTADGVHHADDYIAAWTPLLDEFPELLLYPTMASGGPGISIEDRWGHHDTLVDAGLLRMGLVDPGSVSLGILGDDHLPLPLDLVYVNTYADARHMVEGCARLGLAPSISVFDPSFLRIALVFHEVNALPPGAMVKLYFGGDRTPFGLPPTEASLDAYVAMLAGTGLPWSVAVLGGDVLGSGLAAAALERGGHVRVGLEDYAGPGTPSNVELIDALTELIDASGRTVATHAEADAILGLRG